MAHSQESPMRDHLYTHGYITRTLGVQDTAQYLTRLLRVDEHFLRPTSSHEWPNAFFITDPIIFGVRPSIFITNRPAWLLDYELRNYGTVIPQRIWSPSNPSDAQRYNNVALSMPIFFVQNDRRTLGLQLVHAATGDCMGLLNAGDAAPVGNCHHIAMRIKVGGSTSAKTGIAPVLSKYFQWLGYNEWSTQIRTRDQTTAHTTITLETLAKGVARAVCRFLEDATGQLSQYTEWRVGGDRGITRNDIILIGLIHVSQGSWQPILQLNRP